MKKNENIQLIKGTFHPDDARDVLLGLINYKINFHHMKNFSFEERFGQKDLPSEKRLIELKKSKQQIIELIESANKNDSLLKMEAVITIQLEE